MRMPLTVMAVWAVIFIVPVLAYGLAAAATDLHPPGESPKAFLLGVAISKVGTAWAFVMIYSLGQAVFEEHLWAYVAPWYAMFAIGEVGQAIGPDYSRKEAIYLSASGMIVSRLV